MSFLGTWKYLRGEHTKKKNKFGEAVAGFYNELGNTLFTAKNYWPSVTDATRSACIYLTLVSLRGLVEGGLHTLDNGRATQPQSLHTIRLVGGRQGSALLRVILKSIGSVF